VIYADKDVNADGTINYAPVAVGHMISKKFPEKVTGRAV
jgi:ribosomal protein L31E